MSSKHVGKMTGKKKITVERELCRHYLYTKDGAQKFNDIILY